MANLRERLKQKAEDLRKRGQTGKIIFIKEGTLRARLLNVGEDNDFIHEVTYFYLGKDLGGFISPATFGEPCAAMEAYEELKNSKDSDEKDLAKKFVPKKKGVVLAILYKDEKGKELDTEKGEKLILLSNSLQQELIDKYLDEEWGDMTDPKNGYDIKFKRIGSGKLDTEYSLTTCQRTEVDRKYGKKTYDLEKFVREATPSYEETKDLINRYLNLPPDTDTDSKDNDKESRRERRKKRNRDIE